MIEEENWKENENNGIESGSLKSAFRDSDKIIDHPDSNSWFFSPKIPSQV